MKLKELEPILHDPTPTGSRYIEMLCPVCPRGETRYSGCVIMLPIQRGLHDGACWNWNGETDFDKMTITPSIFHHCKSEAHFFVTNGEIIFA